MSIQIDYNEPRYAQAAAEILRRHDSGEPEELRALRWRTSCAG